MEQLLILSRWSDFLPERKRVTGNVMEAPIFEADQKNVEVQNAGKKIASNEALVPSTMKDCCYAQFCSSITLLKSTLLLSLLTPALDGLLSNPLLPSRLYGTELGDTSEPGKIKVWNSRRDKSVKNIL